MKDCCGVPVSTTLIEKVNVPLTLGVPVMAQLEEFRFKPVGKAPPVVENV